MSRETDAATDRMRAIRVHEHGGPDVLTVERVPRPEPEPDELLVRVRAAGVNPIDWMVREGYTDEALDPSLPYVPGWDLSGTVVATGDEVAAFDPGDAVFGMVRMPEPGATYAEYAAVPAADVTLKPSSLDHVEAAALPMVGLTAQRALFDVGDVTSGEQVLVHAAVGGVGHVAVQLATDAGAHVVGTASDQNADFLRSLGVDEVVDYRQRRFEAVVDDVDVVLDAVGGETLARSGDVLADGGRLVTLPEPPSSDVAERVRAERDASVHWFSVEPDATALTTLRDSVDENRLRPSVSGVYLLSEAAAAHRESRDGHVRGKLVLEVTDGADP